MCTSAPRRLTNPKSRRASRIRLGLNIDAANRQLVGEDAVSSRLIFCWMESFESTNDRDDGPTVGASYRCLNLSTSIGGTRSKVEGGDCHDLEPEGTHEDTRHEIYIGSGGRSSYPTSCLEYCALRLDVDPRRDCGSSSRYPTLLYIVQGWEPSRLQGRSPSRITWHES
jgi:hypothetical protein